MLMRRSESRESAQKKLLMSTSDWARPVSAGGITVGGGNKGGGGGVCVLGGGGCGRKATTKRRYASDELEPWPPRWPPA